MTEQAEKSTEVKARIIATLEAVGRPMTIREIWKHPEMESARDGRGRQPKYMTIDGTVRALLTSGKLTRLPRDGNKAVEYLLPGAGSPPVLEGITERVRQAANRDVALVLAVLRLLYEQGGYMSPENIGPRLTIGPGETVTVEDITRVCHRLFLRGWLREVGGAYAIAPREADDHYGTPSFKNASTVGGVSGAGWLSAMAKLVQECTSAIDPNGDGEQITAETLPTRIEQLRVAYQKMYATLNSELATRHAAEQELASLRARYKDDVAHVEKLLEDERAAAAALAKRFEAMRIVLALLAKD